MLDRVFHILTQHITDQYSALPVHQLLQIPVVVFTRLVGGYLSNSSATETLYLEVFTVVLLHALVGINRTGGEGEAGGGHASL